MIVELMLLLFIGIPILLAFVKVVMEFQRGVKFTLGKYSGLMGPGINILIPFIQSWRRIDVRIHTADIPPQEVMTKDNVPVKVNAVIYYRVIDPEKAVLNIQDYRSAEIAFQKIYQTALNYAVQEEPKTMLLQTYQPEHHTLQAIMQWSYPSFFQKEMEIRKELAYPPFASVIKIEFIGKRRDRIEKSIIDFIDYFQKEATLTNGKFEGQLNKENMMIHETKGTSKAIYVLKISPEKHQCQEFQQKMLQYHLKYQSNDVKLVIDVNPMKMA